MKIRFLFIYFLVLLICGCTTEETKESNYVRVRSIKDFETLNPVTYSGKEAAVVLDLIYQSLLAIDLKDNEIKPILVTDLPKVDVQDSVSFFSYTLRDEAQWPNNKAVTVGDVLFTLKVINCPLIQNERERLDLNFIEDLIIDPASDKKFTFQCEGYVEEMDLMTGGIDILPEYKYDPEGLLREYDLKTLKANFEELKNDTTIQKFAAQFNALAASHEPEAYVGSGGYRLVSWQTDQFITLQKKEDWWADKLSLPYITANPDQITFQIIPDDAAAVIALKNGQLDVLRGIPVNEFTALSTRQHFFKTL